MNDVSEHHRPRLMRARPGWFLGVCGGIARYTGYPAWLVRTAAMVLIILSGGIPGLIGYILAAIVIETAGQHSP